jgi:hypothetical protein
MAQAKLHIRSPNWTDFSQARAILVQRESGPRIAAFAPHKILFYSQPWPLPAWGHFGQPMSTELVWRVPRCLKCLVQFDTRARRSRHRTAARRDDSGSCYEQEQSDDYGDGSLPIRKPTCGSSYSLVG